MELNCIVVLYNTKCEDSLGVNTLIEPKLHNLKIVICDNSEKVDIKENNKRFCNKLEIEYIDMKGNLGLSKAYNKALTRINHDSWFVIFDQDTIVNPNYFHELNKSIANYPNTYIHVPIVKSRGIRISPSVMRGYSVKSLAINNYGLYSNVTAINTGKSCVFEKIGNYNEEIFMDYLDHYFIREYNKNFKNIAIFNCELAQEFSDHDHSDICKDLERFIIYKKDFYHFCNDSVYGYIFYLFKITYRAIKLSIYHKNIVFIRKLFKGNLK